MKKIDIHIHSGLPEQLERHRKAGFETFATPRELREIYKCLGIEKGVLLPWISPECATFLHTNETVLQLVEDYPDLFYWFCCIDCRMAGNSSTADLGKMLRYYKSLGAKGVGEVTSNVYFDNPLMMNLLSHCEKEGMPVLFHISPCIGENYGVVDGLGLPRLEKALSSYPGLIFIGHSQPFWAEMSAALREEQRNTYPSGKVNPGRIIDLMRRYPNLHGDLSATSGYNAVSRDPEFGYQFIEEFQDRLYFGTDICRPWQDNALSFWLDEAVKKGRISDEAYRKVCRENALRLLEG